MIGETAKSVFVSCIFDFTNSFIGPKLCSGTFFYYLNHFRRHIYIHFVSHLDHLRLTRLQKKMASSADFELNEYNCTKQFPFIWLVYMFFVKCLNFNVSRIFLLGTL